MLFFEVLLELLDFVTCFFQIKQSRSKTKDGDDHMITHLWENHILSIYHITNTFFLFDK